ncbi:Six-hairpin glycosidase [Mycena kentingensis (nom. inval.)]|nr:Six-hairpin glycosidase [Mycena kentingensis (nom. inval.)]
MKPFAVSLLLAFVASAIPTNSTLEKRQCQSSLDIANTVATRLQSNFYNANTGFYNGGSRWTDANNIENLATGGNQWSTLGDTSYLGRAVAQQRSTGVSPWPGIVEGSWDDAGWMVLALWKIADYKIARGLDGSAYRTSARSVYDIIEAQWDATVCGGGVWWSSARDYKNSITNELFLLISAVGAINFPGTTKFLTNAQRSRNWIKSSALRNAQGLFNDGLVTSTCANNGQTTWTYNQAVIGAGLGALYATTRDTTLLTDAELTFDAAISRLQSNNILKESCDSATTQSCDVNQVAFKGIFVKHLQYYLDRVNDASRTAKYAGFLHAQASGVFHFGTSAANDIGSVWFAPNAGGSIFGSTSSGSGLAAHVANAKYGPCTSL